MIRSTLTPRKLKLNLSSTLIVGGLFAFSGMANATLIANNGVVYDSETHLTWLQDANTFKTQLAADPNIINKIIATVPIVFDTPNSLDNNGSGQYKLSVADFFPSFGWMNWYAAQGWIGYLNSINYLGYNDWRLPSVAPINGVSFDYSAPNYPNITFDGSTDRAYNITSTQSELSHLFYSLGNNGNFDKLGNQLNIDSPIQSGPFLNMSKLSPEYWTGTEYGPDPRVAWYFDIRVGAQSEGSDKSHPSTIWAVRSENVSTVPEPTSIWLVGIGLAILLGFKNRIRIQG